MLILEVLFIFLIFNVFYFVYLWDLNTIRFPVIYSCNRGVYQM
jgi:hypothetical protein